MVFAVEESLERLHVVVRGRVQGVGFRYAACDMARGLGLAGWVRNLPSGEVEAEFQGTRAKLESALEWCGQGPRVAHVTEVTSRWLPGDADYDGFKIQR